jgi:glucosamine--fructose-6-phosphate aminotransferase (isomerizing)
MCGIFGIMLLNYDNIIDLVIKGLTQLQNRGYDSAGVCLYKNEKFNVYKYASTSEASAIDKLSNININETKNELNEGLYVGIGHNRWATHGVKSDVNAHPHLSNNNKFVIH